MAIEIELEMGKLFKFNLDWRDILSASPFCNSPRYRQVNSTSAPPQLHYNGGPGSRTN